MTRPASACRGEERAAASKGAPAGWVHDHPWLTLAAAASLTVAAVTLRQRRRRRRLLRQGQLVELASAWVRVGSARVHMRYATQARARQAPPVVLVHGWGVSSTYFIPIAERLGPDFNVFAPDLPGHGRSSPPGYRLDVPGQAQALVAWMDAVGLEKVMLVGHSFGCQIAVETALRYSSRVERLVLIGPTVDPQARTLSVQFARLLRTAIFEHPALIVPVVSDYVRMNRRLLPEFKGMMSDAIETKLPALTQPTMLVRGDNDWLVPQRWFEQAAGLASAEFTAVIPRWAHTVQYSAPERLVNTIRFFLSRGLSQRQPDRQE